MFGSPNSFGSNALRLASVLAGTLAIGSLGACGKVPEPKPSKGIELSAKMDVSFRFQDPEAATDRNSVLCHRNQLSVALDVLEQCPNPEIQFPYSYVKVVRDGGDWYVEKVVTSDDETGKAVLERSIVPEEAAVVYTENPAPVSVKIREGNILVEGPEDCRVPREGYPNVSIPRLTFQLQCCEDGGLKQLSPNSESEYRYMPELHSHERFIAECKASSQ